MNVSALRRQVALVGAFGVVLLLAGAVLEPRFLLGSILVWSFCLWVLWRSLDAIYPFETLGSPVLVTLGRGLLVAFVAGLGLVPGATGAPAYTLAVLLDGVDGWLARRQGRVSEVGAKLDLEIDAVGILVASAAGIAGGKLPWWYLAIGLARYAFVLAIWFRKRLGLVVYELDPSPVRRFLAGCQMGFLAVALWPVVPVWLTQSTAFLFGGVTLGVFLRDWLFVSGAHRSSARNDSMAAIDSSHVG